VDDVEADLRPRDGRVGPIASTSAGGAERAQGFGARRGGAGDFALVWAALGDRSSAFFRSMGIDLNGWVMATHAVAAHGSCKFAGQSWVLSLADDLHFGFEFDPAFARATSLTCAMTPASRAVAPIVDEIFCDFRTSRHRCGCPRPARDEACRPGITRDS
jgi:hypothetical protein